METKCGVRVAEVVILRAGTGGAQIDGTERNGLAQRIQAAAGDVGAARDQDGILEQIVRRAVLLKDDHDVLYDGRRRQAQRLRAVARSLAVSVACGDCDGVGPAGRIRRSRHGQSGIDRGVVVIITEGELKEQLGAGEPPVTMLHERVTLPVYPPAGVTVIVDVEVFPAVTDRGFIAAAVSV